MRRARKLTPTPRASASIIEAQARRVMGYYFLHNNGRYGKIVGFVLDRYPPLRYLVVDKDGAGGLEIVRPEDVMILGPEIESRDANHAETINA